MSTTNPAEARMRGLSEGHREAGSQGRGSNVHDFAPKVTLPDWVPFLTPSPSPPTR
eukprot:NODE_7357_length_460_cov_26.055961_g6524_i0.p2 GENE.NODE_7357_length_460_cov_26.055961_g6524_i0~~NODE_7357_length_460_cov_26.055961_g6524_i0.p2  ORF type:complete len:56 (+),score=7.34 NODE_7357_length_460_cov_26.055961_g6524_i0:180-347(+)